MFKRMKKEVEGHPGWLYDDDAVCNFEVFEDVPYDGRKYGSRRITRTFLYYLF